VHGARSPRSARDSYRALVYGDSPGFAEYFRAATPIDVIERMKIGSRPSLRKGDGSGIEQLRAIPWVFAWSQSRHGLPGWYGLGSGLAGPAPRRRGTHRRDGARLAVLSPAAGRCRDGAGQVRRRHRRAAIRAGRAAACALLPAASPSRIQRTREYILRRSRAAASCWNTIRRLRVSIRLRNPYVDPISLLQVELLRRWRAASAEDAAVRGAGRTVNGIAQRLAEHRLRS
jgi:phosphoenolpyruvate carboxylase